MMLHPKKLLALALSAVLVLGLVPVQAVEEDLSQPSEPVVQTAAGDVPIDEEHFPDPVFRECLKAMPEGADNVFTQAELKSIKAIDCARKKNLQDLTGIEYFTEITELYCFDTSITKLDLRKNTKLKELNCHHEPHGNDIHGLLAELDVTGCPDLILLNCYNCSLTELNLSQNPKLASLACNDNFLVALDLSNNPDMEGRVIRFGGNERLVLQNSPISELGSFELSRASSISGGTLTGGKVTFNEGSDTITYYYDLGIAGLEMEKNQVFTLRRMPDIAIDEAHFPDANFRAFVKTLPGGEGGSFTTEELGKIQEIDCSSRRIEDLTGIGLFPNLKTLNCSGNRLSAIDLSKNTQLTTLDCQNNRRAVEEGTSTTRLPGFEKAKVLSETGGSLESGAVHFDPDSTQISYVYNDGNPQVADPTFILENDREVPIDKAHFPDANFRAFLETLPEGQDGIFTGKELESITAIRCYSKGITDLTGIGYFTELTELNCWNNMLTSIDLSGNSKLTIFRGDENSIEAEPGTAMNTMPGFQESKASGITGGRFENGRVVYDEDSVMVTYSYDTGYTGSSDLGPDPVFRLLKPREVLINEANFPDPEFRKALINRHECGKDGKLTALELDKFHTLGVYNGKIEDLTGIDYLYNLGHVQIQYNNLKKVDLSGLPKLYSLCCSGNQLTELDVSHNPELRELICDGNQLTSLDLSQNKKMSDLDCKGNRRYLFPDTPTTELVGFDLSRASNIRGGSLDSGKVVFDEGSDQITYSYDHQAPNRSVTKLPVTLERQTTVEITSDVFPDPNFLEFVKTLEGAEDGQFTREELDKIESINCKNKGIADLTGVELFPNLTLLDCRDNQLTRLDALCFPELDYLYCQNNRLTTLDVSGCTGMYSLDCQNNQLTQLDLSKQTRLKQLYCSDNRLTTLNVSEIPTLDYLCCQNNQLKTLDVRKATYLSELRCENNQLTELDLSGKIDLTDLGCENNQLVCLDLTDSPEIKTLLAGGNVRVTSDYQDLDLGALDVARVTELTGGHIDGTTLRFNEGVYEMTYQYEVCPNRSVQFTIRHEHDGWQADGTSHWQECHCGWTTEPVPHSFGAWETTRTTPNYIEKQHTCTVCGYTETTYDNVLINEANFPDANFRGLVKTDVAGGDDGVLTQEELSKIKGVWCNRENIADLTGIGFFTEMESLNCGNNKLTSLDVSHNTKLKFLTCEYNDLTDLDLSHNTQLEQLVCGYNEFPSAGPNLALPKLRKLQIDGSSLTTLDVSSCPALAELVCKYNQLTTLDLSHNPALVKLRCQENQLTTLDLSHNSALTHLYCLDNQLKTLDLSHNPAFKDLDCSANQLKTLDLSHNPALDVLYCGNNQLKTLDLSHNSALTHLYCLDNQLTTLDLSHNPALAVLYCLDNQLTTLDLSRNEKLVRLDISSNPLPYLHLNQKVKALDLFYADDMIYRTGEYQQLNIPGLDVGRISGLTGGRIDGNTLSFDEGQYRMNYTYRLNDHIVADFGIQHDHAPEEGWQKDETNHWHSCACGDPSSKFDLAAHTYGDWIVTKPAEVGVEGSQERECSVCHYKQTEVIPALAEGVSVSGTVTSAGEGEASVTLTAPGAEAPAYTAVVADGAYTMSNVTPGTYTMTVSKKNHVTRTYEVTVSDAGLTQDVVICLIGDITGDGLVDMRDWTRLYDHLNEYEVLTEAYDLIRADIDRSGVIDLRDWTRLYKHLNETHPLW